MTTEKALYSKELRSKRILNNQCPYCGIDISNIDYCACDNCRKRRNNNTIKRRNNHIKKGLCPYCGNEKENKKYYSCLKCYKYFQNKLKERKFKVNKNVF